MIHAKQVLCIDPEPSDLGIGAMMDRRGVALELTEASSQEVLRKALERPGWWDLILCDDLSFEVLAVESAILSVRDELDASLVLLKSSGSTRSSRQSYQLGAADLVARDDLERLLVVCERELGSCALRKEIRHLRRAAGAADPGVGHAMVLATIQDLSRAGRHRKVLDAAAEDESTLREASSGKGRLSDGDRIRALIDAGGLTLEFQPIISLRGDEEHRSMFETLVRLKDDSGKLLMPAAFLPIVESAGWMSKIDVWILRRALATLKEMQEDGAKDTVLFINVATETLRSEQAAKALGAFVSAAQLIRGSVVVEVRTTAFTETWAHLEPLARLLKAKHHGLLVEDTGIDDCDFLSEHRDLITHIKLDRGMTQGLLERKVSQDSVNDLVRCARREGMRVIALAVDNAELLPMLFAAGVDAIQGHFVSMPYQNLMYPSIQRVESSSTPGWQGPGR